MYITLDTLKRFYAFVGFVTIGVATKLFTLVQTALCRPSVFLHIRNNIKVYSPAVCS